VLPSSRLAIGSLQSLIACASPPHTNPKGDREIGCLHYGWR
jgi:hypothetical protein